MKTCSIQWNYKITRPVETLPSRHAFTMNELQQLAIGNEMVVFHLQCLATEVGRRNLQTIRDIREANTATAGKPQTILAYVHVLQDVATVEELPDEVEEVYREIWEEPDLNFLAWQGGTTLYHVNPDTIDANEHAARVVSLLADTDADGLFLDYLTTKPYVLGVDEQPQWAPDWLDRFKAWQFDFVSAFAPGVYSQTNGPFTLWANGRWAVEGDLWTDEALGPLVDGIFYESMCKHWSTVEPRDMIVAHGYKAGAILDLFRCGLDLVNEATAIHGLKENSYICKGRGQL